MDTSTTTTLNNKVTILCNGAEEASNIDRSKAQEELERLTLLVDQAETKKVGLISESELKELITN